MLELCDSKLKDINEENMYFNNIRNEVLMYKQEGVTISDYSISPEEDVIYKYVEGMDLARVDIVYTMTKGEITQSVDYIYIS